MKALIETLIKPPGKKWIYMGCLILCLPLGALAQSPESSAMTLEELLQSVKEGRAENRRSDRARLSRFEAEKAEREQMLDDIRTQRAGLEQLSSEKEATFEENELMIGELEERLQQRMGSLKELFGVLQQVASDAQGQFHNSLTELHHPERSDFLVDFAARMGHANRLPEIGEIERLWFELQQEITESAQVVTWDHPVVTREGAEVPLAVTRVGLFNVVADGKFLQFIPETGRLIEFSRQPSSRYMQGPRALASGDDAVIPFAVDPVRGQLLQLLTQAPNLRERVGQGGVIGYTIIGLGIMGLSLALWRLVVLYAEGSAIRKQMATLDRPLENNALGRVMLAARGGHIKDVETLELHLGEAVLSEVPRINRALPLLKIVAAVAPLMGLLGTVTGMIITFQAITLFGAGDPRLMAGGISQALMTTVLGLCVAIPMLLLHNVVQTRARSISEILQQKAIAIVAARAEHFNSATPVAPVEDTPRMAS